MINLKQIELGDRIYTPDGIFEVVDIYVREDLGYKRITLNDRKETYLFGEINKEISNTKGWYRVAKTIISVTSYVPSILDNIRMLQK